MALLLAAAPAALAQSLLPAAAPEPPGRRLPAVSLLPNNSTLQEVMIPRYDEDRRLLAVLRARHMRIIDEDNVKGSEVAIEFHRPEGGLRGHIDLRQARFDQKSGLLHGDEQVALRSDTLRADGRGLVFELANSRGFLLGPADTRFYPRPTETSMSTPVFHPRLGALLAASLAVLPGAATAAAEPSGPGPLDAARLERMDRDAVSLAPDAARSDREIGAVLASTGAMSRAAGADLASFLRMASLTALLADAAPAAGAAVQAPAEEFDVGPGGTRVLADGGMYFDTKKGILVYLKNIRLSDSRFDLQCRDELKVFLAKEAAGNPKAGAKAQGGAADQAAPAAAGQGAAKRPAGGGAAGAKPQAGSGNLLGGDFGDIDRLVASGAVRVTRKDPQGLPVVATADTATYEAGSGDVILRGGFPTVRKGKDYLRALEPGLYIRLYANGDVFAQPGKWETGVSQIKDKEQPAKPR